ncbi:MAG: carboxymuconolactone decarboxylase family protein [Bryobacteraceae bacterium]
MAPADSSVFAEVAPGARVPNTLRALAALPGAIRPYSDLMHAAIYRGVVEPELKLAMGLRIAALHSSGYLAVHLDRLIQATERGRELLSLVTQSESAGSGSTPEQLALAYASLLTRDVHGVSEAEFARLRTAYNDSQIVELTMTVCLFNYLTRMVHAFNLPVEPWALEPARFRSDSPYQRPAARVSLVSDNQMEAFARLRGGESAPQSRQSGLGLGIANSMRAMVLSPEFASAWRAYWGAVRQEASLGRDILLQVSFAVSNANGCRYCTIHQVLGLRRLGVDPVKLLQMKKDDSALTPRELVAVRFARKLTTEPASVTDADYATLQSEFGERGAMEVVLQTCAFAFMNRFTDGLRLPSEDEAIRVYREVYGPTSE